jgi:hypothetical protein
VVNINHPEGCHNKYKQSPWRQLASILYSSTELLLYMLPLYHTSSKHSQQVPIHVAATQPASHDLMPPPRSVCTASCLNHPNIYVPRKITPSRSLAAHLSSIDTFNSYETNSSSSCHPRSCSTRRTHASPPTLLFIALPTPNLASALPQVATQASGYFSMLVHPMNSPAAQKQQG